MSMITRWKLFYKWALIVLIILLLFADVATLFRLGVQTLHLYQETNLQESDALEQETELPELSWTPYPCTDEDVQAILSQMDIREKIYQLFIVTPEQLIGSGSSITAMDESLRQALAEYPVGGIVFFKENLLDPAQTSALLAEMQSASRVGLFLSVDEEGGSVSRLASNPQMGMVDFDTMNKIGATGNTGLAYQVGCTIGSEIRELGFNLDFAPVADTYLNPQNQVVLDRSFSSDPAVVAQMVSAAVRGFQNSGMICTLKHFPGHGSTPGDSHTEKAVSDKSVEELEKSDFIPFRAGIDVGAPVVMVGHISCPQIDPNLPASLSYRIVTELLRNQLGFEGLIVTDALRMQSVTSVYASDYAAVEAFCAGCDLLLMPMDFQAAADALLNAVNSGRITQERLDESVRKIIELKIQYGIISI